MKVAELIEKLKTMPLGAEVEIEGPIEVDEIEEAVSDG